MARPNDQLPSQELPRRSLSLWSQNFLRRHDSLGLARQARLAMLLLYVNLLIIGVTLLTSVGQVWSEQIPTKGLIELSCLTGLTMLLLVLGSDLRRLSDLALGTVAGTPTGPTHLGALDRYRPFIFYPSVYLNIVTLGLLVHITGGLTGSPYTSLLYALFLIALQFSRFRRQSGYYLLTGLIVTVAIIVWDAAQPPSLATEPPRNLIATMTIGSFVFAAIVGQVSKQGNPRSAKRSALPSSAALYRDPEQRWRFVLYGRSSALDGIALNSSGAACRGVKEAKEAVARAAAHLMPQGESVSISWTSDLMQGDAFTAALELTVKDIDEEDSIKE